MDHARDDESGGMNGGSRHSKRQKHTLNWRMDPHESHSDYTLEIAQEENGKVIVYHVHKTILEFGVRSSVYFAGVFASQTAESTNNKTRISFPKSAAEVFPLLLDHMYGLEDDESVLTIENAAPIYHMADYLEVETLQAKILQFWKENVCVEHFGTCLKQVASFHNDNLHIIVVKKFVRSVFDIAFDSPLIDSTGPAFWLDVRSEIKELDIPNYSSRYTRLVVEFCHKKKNILDQKAFRKLTKWTNIYYELLSFI